MLCATRSVERNDSLTRIEQARDHRASHDSKPDEPDGAGRGISKKSSRSSHDASKANCTQRQQ
jgi:hypothetical protein